MSDLPIDVDAEAIFLDGGWYTREDLSRRIKAMLDAGDFNVAKPSAALEQLTHTVSTVRTLMFRSTPDLAEGLNQVAARSGQSVGAVIREAVTQYLTDQGIAAKSAGPGGAQKAPAPSGALSPASPPSNAIPLTSRASPPVSAPTPPSHGAAVAPAPVVAYPVPSAHTSGFHAAPVPPPLPAAPAASFSSLPMVIDVEEDETPQQQEPTVRRAMPMAPTGNTQDDLPKVIVEEQPMVIAGPGALANAGVAARPIELTQKKS
jgi:hypothetical protein